MNREVILIDPECPPDRWYAMPLTEEDIKEKIKHGAYWFCQSCRQSVNGLDHVCSVLLKEN